MANSETILSATTHPDDSTETVVAGEKFKGDGYYGRSDGIHTTQYDLSGFIGTVAIQATLAIDPIDTDWFTVFSEVYTSAATESAVSNFTGNYVWIRALITYTGGTVNSIKLNH
jgi:hypothetical protein